MTKIGVKEHIDPELMNFYKSYYDVMRTPDFDEKTRLLKPKHGLKKIGQSQNRVCRFCGKTEKEVTFKKVAHIFPEAIGNKALASNYECDECNDFFGQTIENDYAKYFSLYHSIMQISGKGGIPHCGFKISCPKKTDACHEHCVEISFNKGKINIRKCIEVNDEYVKLKNNSMILSKPIGSCCPIAVYKAITKMAMSVMPIEDLTLFTNTIKWLRAPNHTNINIGKKMLVRYQMIPGFNVTKYPHFILYRRKRTEWQKPYMLFNLTYGCFSLLIEIPRNNDNSSNTEFEKIPFPPIPFHTLGDGFWDLSSNSLPQGTKHSMTLEFGAITDITDNVSDQSF